MTLRGWGLKPLHLCVITYNVCSQIESFFRLFFSCRFAKTLCNQKSLGTYVLGKTARNDAEVSHQLISFIAFECIALTRTVAATFCLSVNFLIVGSMVYRGVPRQRRGSNQGETELTTVTGRKADSLFITH